MRFLARLVCAWTLCLPSARSREDAVLYLVQGRADQAARWLELTSSDPTAAPPLLFLAYDAPCPANGGAWCFHAPSTTYSSGRNLLVETNVVAMNIEAVAEWAPQKREEKRRERQRERHQWVAKASARRAAYEAEEARRAEEEAARSRPTPRVARPAPPFSPPDDTSPPTATQRARMLARELARML